MVKPKISASILSANPLELRPQLAEVLPLLDEVHLDIMDGVFVNNISFGPGVAGAIRSAFPAAVIDTHLMVSRPDRLWRHFSEAGSDSITFHLEALDEHFGLLEEMAAVGLRAGVAISPATDVHLIAPVVHAIDRLLVATVEPGQGGQGFQAHLLPKIEAARRILGENCDLQLDGGINDKTIQDARLAGANVFVVGSYIFSANDSRERVSRLRDIIAS